MNPPIDLTYVCNFVGTLEAGAINYLEGGARLGWEEPERRMVVPVVRWEQTT